MIGGRATGPLIVNKKILQQIFSKKGGKFYEKNSWV